MDALVGTRNGVFHLDGYTLVEVAVSHLARRNGEWWAVGETGLVRNGEHVAAPPDGVDLNCVAVGTDTVWVGADSARLFFLRGGELVEDVSFAAAPGRESWHTPWGGPPDVRSLSVGPDGVLYVNVHVGGILRAEQTGFVPTLDIGADVHQVVAHPGRPDVVVAATARGLAWTEDGRHFDFRTRGLEYLYCRAVAVHDDTVLVSASRGPRGGEARLYRGSLSGGDLQPCSHLPEVGGNIDTHCVLAGRGAYLVGNGSTVWRSADGGESWQVAVEGLAPITSLA